MKAFITPFAVIALNQLSYLDELRLLKEYGFSFKEAQGCYKGENERSYIIPCRNDVMKKNIIALARHCNQEGILFVRSDGSAYNYRIAFNGGPIIEELGMFKRVDELSATRAGFYTKLNNKYYIAA